MWLLNVSHICRFYRKLVDVTFGHLFAVSSYILIIFMYHVIYIRESIGESNKDENYY